MGLDETIRWGVIGPGRIAQDFISDLSAVEGAKLAAVASRSLERANEFAAKFAADYAFDSYETLITHPDVDVVYVATPHNFHFEQTIKCLKAGKAVVCEKPIAVKPSELRELIEAKDQSGTYLMEALWTYFLPAIQVARSWIDQGKIGTLRHLKAEFGYMVDFDPNSRAYNPKLAGGALLDMGIYPIAMAAFFIPEPIVEKQVFARPAITGVDKDVHIVFRYENSLASLSTSFECKLPNFLHLIGDEGYIEIPDFWKAKTCTLYRQEEQIDQFVDNRETFGFEYEIKSVCDDLRASRLESDTMPLSRSMQLQEIMADIKMKFAF